MCVPPCRRFISLTISAIAIVGNVTSQIQFLTYRGISVSERRKKTDVVTSVLLHMRVSRNSFRLDMTVNRPTVITLDEISRTFWYFPTNHKKPACARIVACVRRSNSRMDVIHGIFDVCLSSCFKIWTLAGVLILDVNIFYMFQFTPFGRNLKRCNVQLLLANKRAR